MTTTTEIRAITLSPNYYEPRQTVGGGSVCDAMPYDGAVEYVTGMDEQGASRWGIRFDDGAVDWLGDVGTPLPEVVKLVAIEADEVSASDLRREIATCTERGEECEAYRVRMIDADGYERSGSVVEVLYIPGVSRGGVEWGGGAEWTDADSAEEVVWRSLLGQALP